MDASDYLHAQAVAWYYQPCLPAAYPHTSEVINDLAVLRDCRGSTVAIVNRNTDSTIFDRDYLRQFDLVFS
jgi:hypothetical protein